MNIHSTPQLVELDLILSGVIPFVIAGHFSMNTGFQQAVFEEPSMFIQEAGEFFFGKGVPLFLLLTGYLHSKKEATLQYYKGGIQILDPV